MPNAVFMLEDDSDDRYLTQETLNELGIAANVEFFSNSNDLLAALSSSGKPFMILLDYNATPDNGLQVLKKIKTNSFYNDIPVIILSDNDLAFYKRECYASGASSFIKKPTTLEGTKQKIGTFFKYWFEVAET